MRVFKKISDLRNYLHSSSNKVGCVPTMGNIHNGHLSLVKLAKENCDTVITTIFVNPMQFGPNEDFSGYPRTLDQDIEKLEKNGCDIIFCPDIDEIYPDNQEVAIALPKISRRLEGRFRPSLFSGVATVVTKLFNIVSPDVAIFGKKDYQQLAIIKMLVKQLSMNVKIISGETIRDEDGLALSSRNRYLDKTEREIAPQLNVVIKEIKESLEKKDTNYVAMEYEAGQVLSRKGWDVDYVVIRTQNGLLRPSENDKELVVLGAAKLGQTRLIDNVEVFI